MGCLHSKPKDKPTGDWDGIQTAGVVTEEHLYDPLVYDNLFAPGYVAPPPIDYSKVETADVLKLRDQLKELECDEEKGNYGEEILLQKLFSHMDSLHPRPAPTANQNSKSKPAAPVLGGIGFGDAHIETQEVIDRKAILLQKETNLTRVYQLLQKHLPQATDETEKSVSASLSSKLLELCRASCFIHIARELLHNDSILDLSLHSKLYTALFSLLEAFSLRPALRPLLLDPVDGSSESLHSLFEKLQQTAAMYLYLAGTVSQAEGDPVALELANLIVRVWNTIQNPKAISSPLLPTSSTAAPNPTPAASEPQKDTRKETAPSSSTSSNPRLRTALSRRQNRNSTFEALARGTVPPPASAASSSLRSHEQSTTSSSTRPETISPTEEKDITKEPSELQKEKQPMVAEISPSSPSAANAVVELKPQTEERQSTPHSTPLLKNWKPGTARELPAAEATDLLYPDFLGGSSPDLDLDFDEFGNPIRPVIAPEDRKPHPSLTAYMDKELEKFDGKRYCDVLREHLFGNAPIDVTKHHYRNMFEANMSKTKMSRLLSELGTLARSLPLSEGSSVFLRCAEKGIDVMKALIIGPEGTPYENGCFVFDIYLPSQYPSVPPVVHLCTTGGGTVRFNPNLYADGKVCLSLLGTWSGEPWGPSSTLLQVLVSIQSLILVPYPYYNEPGWECYQNTPEGPVVSKKYNDNLLGDTVTWAMHQHLVTPDDAFSDVIAAHFYLKRNEIRKQMIRWNAESQYPNLLTQPITKLMAELEKLEKNPPKIVIE